MTQAVAKVQLRIPKNRQLTTEETLNTFKSWKENLVFGFSIEDEFKPFLVEGCTWGKLTAASPNRGLTDDGDPIPATKQRTKEQKVASLNLMLGQIANHCTIISRNQIVKNSVSLIDIWEKIRQHYGFHTTGARFLDLTALKLNLGERPEDFYQRLVSFVDDNLLTADSTLTHHGSRVTRDEEISPSLENVTVMLWLERIHVNLPGLVKQKYGAELRNKTLATIKPEISAALSSLLDELSVGEDSRILRFQSSNFRNRGRGQFPSRSSSPVGNQFSRSSSPQGGGKSCCLCRASNRPDNHFLSQCRFLPEGDRRRFASSRVRAIETQENEDDFDNYGNYPDEIQHLLLI